ncbi:hypothetical protein Nocox_19275 [Nonomuraea coxensis DSM 45129]|uniref:Septum formation-related domain-containing protein n=1 Tax=Nonomuraea coxensis DSM 45129 TaxID=1122611 RepID=A0ABX8U1C2_9ACTN|nr:hypothetical protein Nocox_19275 [Nonomuraea coxensis DSM 45129]
MTLRHLTATAFLAGALAGCAAAPAPPSSAVPTTVGAVQPGVEQIHASELRPGDCLAPMPESFAVTLVSCSEPHAAEYATTYVVPDQPWPGQEALDLLAREGCAPRMRYVPERRAEVTVAVLVPDEASWPRHRTAYCLAVPADGGELVGRVIL